MTSQEYLREYDVREEGTTAFEWPLNSEEARLPAGELLDRLIVTIQTLNRLPEREWNRTILTPKFGSVIVDRDARSITAVCLWKRKPKETKENER